MLPNGRTERMWAGSDELDSSVVAMPEIERALQMHVDQAQSPDMSHERALRAGPDDPYSPALLSSRSLSVFPGFQNSPDFLDPRPWTPALEPSIRTIVLPRPNTYPKDRIMYRLTH